MNQSSYPSDSSRFYRDSPSYAFGYMPGEEQRSPAFTAQAREDIERLRAKVRSHNPGYTYRNGVSLPSQIPSVSELLDELASKVASARTDRPIPATPLPQSEPSELAQAGFDWKVVADRAIQALETGTHRPLPLANDPQAAQIPGLDIIAARTAAPETLDDTPAEAADTASVDTVSVDTASGGVESVDTESVNTALPDAGLEEMQDLAANRVYDSDVLESAGNDDEQFVGDIEPEYQPDLPVIPTEMAEPTPISEPDMVTPETDLEDFTDLAAMPTDQPIQAEQTPVSTDFFSGFPNQETLPETFLAESQPELSAPGEMDQAYPEELGETDTLGEGLEETLPDNTVLEETELEEALPELAAQPDLAEVLPHAALPMEEVLGEAEGTDLPQLQDLEDFPEAAGQFSEAEQLSEAGQIAAAASESPGEQDFLNETPESAAQPQETLAEAFPEAITADAAPEIVSDGEASAEELLDLPMEETLLELGEDPWLEESLEQNLPEETAPDSLAEPEESEFAETQSTENTSPSEPQDQQPESGEAPMESADLESEEFVELSTDDFTDLDLDDLDLESEMGEPLSVEELEALPETQPEAVAEAVSDSTAPAESADESEIQPESSDSAEPNLVADSALPGSEAIGTQAEEDSLTELDGDEFADLDLGDLDLLDSPAGELPDEFSEQADSGNQAEADLAQNMAQAASQLEDYPQQPADDFDSAAQQAESDEFPSEYEIPQVAGDIPEAMQEGFQPPAPFPPAPEADAEMADAQLDDFFSESEADLSDSPAEVAEDAAPKKSFWKRLFGR